MLSGFLADMERNIKSAMDNKYMWKNLAPKILRQRLVIEGTTERIVSESQMESYLIALAGVAKMKIAGTPVTFTEHENGSAAYINWTSSGVHFYSYPTKPPLFTVDIYSCKAYSVDDVVEFTRKFFNPIGLIWKEI